MRIAMTPSHGNLGLALLLLFFFLHMSFSFSSVIKLPQYDDLGIRPKTTLRPWYFENYTRIPNLEGSAYSLSLPGGGATWVMYKQVYDAFLGQFFPAMFQYFRQGFPKYLAKCLSMNIKGNCLTKISDFDALYGAVSPKYRPAVAGFTSDEAFAYIYLTYKGQALTIVNDLADIPFDTSKIVGLDSIIAKTNHNLSELIALKRVFSVDMTPYAPYIDPAPNGVLELPYGLFFVDGANASTGNLMPLAISYPLETPVKVFSPLDSYLSWFLAKGNLNMIVRDLFLPTWIGNMYFTLICASGRINFAANHPLACLLKKYCRRQYGLMSTLYSEALTDGGLYDQLRSVSGYSMRITYLPYLANTTNWNNFGFKNSLASQGIQDDVFIPGYYWRDDLTAINGAIKEYVTKYVELFYSGDQDVINDWELQAFATTLQEQIPQFPVIKDMETLISVFNTILLVPNEYSTANSAGRYALNTVLPITPMRYLKPLPADKIISEEEAMTYYLFPTLPALNSPVSLVLNAFKPVNTFGEKGGRRLSNISDFISEKTQIKAQKAIDQLQAAWSASTLQSSFGVNASAGSPNGTTTYNSGFNLFFQMSLTGSLYFPQFQRMNSQIFGYCPAVRATLGFTQVHAEFVKALKNISAEINRRNDLIRQEGRLPVFKIFNPIDAPYMFIT